MATMQLLASPVTRAYTSVLTCRSQVQVIASSPRDTNVNRENHVSQENKTASNVNNNNLNEKVFVSIITF